MWCRCGAAHLHAIRRRARRTRCAPSTANRRPPTRNRDRARASGAARAPRERLRRLRRSSGVRRLQSHLASMLTVSERAGCRAASRACTASMSRSSSIATCGRHTAARLVELGEQPSAVQPRRAARAAAGRSCRPTRRSPACRGERGLQALVPDRTAAAVRPRLVERLTPIGQEHFRVDAGARGSRAPQLVAERVPGSDREFDQRHACGRFRRGCRGHRGDRTDACAGAGGCYERSVVSPTEPENPARSGVATPTRPEEHGA